MRLKLRSSWLVSTPVAYTWFLSNRRNRQVRPMLYATSAVNPSTSRTSLLGVNQRFWQPRLAPQTNRVRLVVAFVVSCGLLLSAARGVALALTQTLNSLSILHALSALMQAPLLLGIAFTLVFLKHRLAALAVFSACALITQPSTLSRPSTARLAQEHTANQSFWPTSTPAYSHVLLTCGVFRLSKGLALLEPSCLPNHPTAFSDARVLATFRPAPTIAWIRFVEFAGAAASSHWTSFNLQCIERAVAARLLAANWARQAESLRGTPVSWTLAYPQTHQVQFTGANLMPMRSAPITEPACAPSFNYPQYPIVLNAHAIASFSASVTNLSAEQALALIQTPLAWAPLKVTKVNWD